MSGLLDYNNGVWVARDLEPHVAMRFKDVFKGVPFGSRPPFLLKDRLDRATDLDWFMSRYPLTLTDAASLALTKKKAEHKAHMRDVEHILSGAYVPSALSGFKDGEEPEAYQRRAAQLFRTTGRLLLLDDVGLGKTVSFLASVADGWGLPAAVVVQPHLSAQWVTQYINRFTHLTAHEIKTTRPGKVPPVDVYVFRYSNIAGWVDQFEAMGLKTACFDEVQELRHGRSTSKGYAGRALARHCENVIGLTATPIYNYGGEIFEIVELIEPGALGTWEEFTLNWCTTHGNHWIVKSPAALGAYLIEQGIALRRQNDDPEVSQSLPPLSKVVFEVAWNEGDADDNHKLQKQLAQRIVSGSFHDRGMAARELDMLLRQDTGVAKARAVAAYVRILVEQGEQVLLAGWHRRVYEIWLEEMADLSAVLFTGSESQAQKAKAKQAFIDGEARVMIMSLRSGAGLDGLQHVCQHVVYGEFDWSPQVHTQFTGRVRRRGQTKPVTAHFLHTNGGSDPVVMSTLGLKASQSHGILNPFVPLQAAVPVDTSRMRKLAEYVLNGEGVT